MGKTAHAEAEKWSWEAAATQLRNEPFTLQPSVDSENSELNPFEITEVENQAHFVQTWPIDRKQAFVF